jgi:hypothetical protein
MATAVLVINLIYLVFVIGVTIRGYFLLKSDENNFTYSSSKGYLESGDNKNEFAKTAGIISLTVIFWFSFAVLFLTSLFGFLLTAIIGNFGWLIAVLFTSLVFYSVIEVKHGKNL